MIDLEHCIALGSISRTHSIKGQVILRLKHAGFTNIKNMEPVFIIIDGLPVPFFVSHFKLRNNHEYLLTIEDISTEQQASALIDKELWIASDKLDSTESDPKHAVHYLAGYQVQDENLGTIGILEEVLDIDQNPLLRILNGKREILIPLQPEFILNVDEKLKTILVNTPEGLVDLY